MNRIEIDLAGETLAACPSGALWWKARRLLVVSDLHLGKSERIARRHGTLLPPYEGRETLARLAEDIGSLDPAEVICLGDSFDDPAAAQALPDDLRATLARLQAGRGWTWIAGNHDPGPVEPGGTHRVELSRGPLTFRHIAQDGATAEISGHYHPKAVLSLRGKRVSRPCFLVDSARIVMPAFGVYTGGLRWTDPALQVLMEKNARAILTGRVPACLPMPHKREPCQ